MPHKLEQFFITKSGAYRDDSERRMASKYLQSGTTYAASQ